jgi:hypothetical protein
MSTLASELDIPEITVDDAASFGDRMAMRAALPDDVWLVRNLIGYAVLRYEDAIGVLRDKRWHSASGRIPELMGITREDFLVAPARQHPVGRGRRARAAPPPRRAGVQPARRPTACGRSCAR